MIPVAIGIVVVLAIVTFVMRSPSPTKAARRRISAQLASVRSQLAALQVDDRGYVSHQEDLVRQQWLADQLARPVDSLDVPGFGDAMFESLRESRITKLRDIELLRTKKVPGVGEKRAAQLWSTYKDELARLQAEARALDRATLDTLSGGKLGALVEKEATEELQRQRELESTQIRIAELERRLAQLP